MIFQRLLNSFFFTRRFFPLFWVQFLGAFNDNVFKNAMVMLITFRLAQTSHDVGLLITLAAGVFILPFFLFSALAGQIADHFDKTRLIRKIKLAEILVMMTGGVAFVMQDLVLLFAVLFLMGAQSAFFGPIKYAILPEHLNSDELLDGNGWFSASTFIAILLGTLIGGMVVLSDQGADWMAVLVVAIALLGYLASLRVPPSITGHAEVKIRKNFLKSTALEVMRGRRHPQAFFAVLAISWFWFLGATYLSQMPVLVKDVLLGDDKIVVLFLATFSVGIGLGAAIVGQLEMKVRSVAQVKWLLLVLLGISAAMLVSNGVLQLSGAPTTPLTLDNFFSNSTAVTVWALLAAVATLGGIYIVPLYTLLQVQTPQAERSRLVAVNNITNAIYMVISSILIMVLYAFGWRLVSILAFISLMNLAVVWWYYRCTSTLSKNKENE
ncbi:MAG: MFS transporter [Hydrogenovibrio sp.]|nr:MFS transporter [Hydrogenovibrio sp.]